MSEIRENRRSEILQAACKEFSEKGFAGAKIEDIAHRCGIGKSTVYEYFPSKSDLLEETVDWIIGRVTVDVERMMEGTGSFAEKARAYLLYICRLMHKMGHELLYMYGDHTYGDKQILSILQKCTQLFLQRIVEAATQAVQYSQQTGELRGDIAAKEIAILVITLPSPLLAEQLANGDTESVDHMVELLLNGFAAK